MLGIVGYSFIGYKNLNWSMRFTLFLCVSTFVNAVMGYTYVFDYLLGAIVNGGIIAFGKNRAIHTGTVIVHQGKINDLPKTGRGINGHRQAAENTGFVFLNRSCVWKYDH